MIGFPSNIVAMLTKHKYNFQHQLQNLITCGQQIYIAVENIAQELQADISKPHDHISETKSSAVVIQLLNMNFKSWNVLTKRYHLFHLHRL
jgi:hypothetical protein